MRYIKKFKPDVIISDFEPLSNYWSYFIDKPLISLDKGRGAGATFAQRKMTSSSNVADTLNYTLYTDALTVWGDGTEGSSQHRYDGNAVVINAVIPKGQAPAAGSYTDTIVVTLSF